MKPRGEGEGEEVGECKSLWIKVGEREREREREEERERERVRERERERERERVRESKREREREREGERESKRERESESERERERVSERDVVWYLNKKNILKFHFDLFEPFICYFHLFFYWVNNSWKFYFNGYLFHFKLFERSVFTGSKTNRTFIVFLIFDEHVQIFNNNVFDQMIKYSSNLLWNVCQFFARNILNFKGLSS